MSGADRSAEVLGWLEFARRDLRIVAALHANDPTLFTACVRAQQAAEKSLKAVLVLHDQRFRKHQVVVQFWPLHLVLQRDLLEGRAPKTDAAGSRILSAGDGLAPAGTTGRRTRVARRRRGRGAIWRVDSGGLPAVVLFRGGGP